MTSPFEPETWHFPTSIRFGPGRIADLPAACRELAMARPLMVTDRGLADQPLVHDALARLEAGGLGRALFSDVQGNPTEANVAAGIEAARAGDHDGVVAIGGGMCWTTSLWKL